MLPLWPWYWSSVWQPIFLGKTYENWHGTWPQRGWRQIVTVILTIWIYVTCLMCLGDWCSPWVMPCSFGYMLVLQNWWFCNYFQHVIYCVNWFETCPVLLVKGRSQQIQWDLYPKSLHHCFAILRLPNPHSWRINPPSKQVQQVCFPFAIGSKVVVCGHYNATYVFFFPDVDSNV